MRPSTTCLLVLSCATSVIAMRVATDDEVRDEMRQWAQDMKAKGMTGTERAAELFLESMFNEDFDPATYDPKTFKPSSGKGSNEARTAIMDGSEFSYLVKESNKDQPSHHASVHDHEML